MKRGTAAFSPHTRVSRKRAQERAPRMGPRASCNLISAAHPSHGFRHVLSVRRQSVQPTVDGETCTVIDPRRWRSLVAVSESWRLSTTQHATCHGSLKHPGVAGFIRKTRCPLLIQKKNTSQTELRAIYKQVTHEGHSLDKQSVANSLSTSLSN